VSVSGHREYRVDYFTGKLRETIQVLCQCTVDLKWFQEIQGLLFFGIEEAVRED